MTPNERYAAKLVGGDVLKALAIIVPIVLIWKLSQAKPRPDVSAEDIAQAEADIQAESNTVTTPGGNTVTPTTYATEDGGFWGVVPPPEYPDTPVPYAPLD